MEESWNKVSRSQDTNFSFFAIYSRPMGSAILGSFGAHVTKFNLFVISQYKSPTSWYVVFGIQDNKVSTLHSFLKTPKNVCGLLFGSFGNILIKKLFKKSRMVFRMPKDVKFLVLISRHNIFIFRVIIDAQGCFVVILSWFSRDHLNKFY